MSDIVIVAAIAFCGNIAVGVISVIASGQLTNYRLKQLEEKVSKHNNLIERMTVVEQSAKSAHKRLDELHDEMEDLK